MEFRSRLRSATAARHRDVDALFSTLQLNKPSDYRLFLRCHARAVIALEQALGVAGAERHLDDWRLRTRSPALAEDLAELGETLPSALPVEAFADEGAFWGAAYVLEGSRLGSRILAQRAAGAAQSPPLRYLLHGSKEPFWPRFLQRFEERASACDWVSMEQAAQRAFSCFVDAARLEGLQANPPQLQEEAAG